jgi:hypothetical protein
MSEAVKELKKAHREPAAAPSPPPAGSPAPSPARACVGLPVQYHDGREVIPGVLQRRSIVNPDVWDVKVSLHGAGTAVTRAAVRHSEKPAPGCWSFLPA